MIFSPSKDELIPQILFFERLKTILFLSMLKGMPITVLDTKNCEYVKDGQLHTDVVKEITGGNGKRWEKAISGSFKFIEGDWIALKDIHSVNLSAIISINEFLEDEGTLNRVQHLGLVPAPDYARNSLAVEVEDENDSKYYRLLCSKLP